MSPQTIAYDESGNPTTYLGATLTWKNGRQLASYTKGTKSVTYEYNESGLRTQKTVTKSGTTTTYNYTWSEDKLTHQTWDNYYLHFYYDYSDEIVGFEYFDGTTVEYYTYVKNMQGDVVAIIDSDGVVDTTYEYDAWGKLDGSSGGLDVINPIRYRGYYYDEEISMYYLQSRYYNPTVGRFINADDTDYIGYTETMLSYNIFAYCENNVVMHIDQCGKVFKKNKNKVYKAAIFFTSDAGRDYTEYAKQLKKDLKKVVSIQVKLLKVNWSSEFINEWNKLGKYDVVFILCHGTRGGLANLLTYNILEESFLKKKNIKNLVLLSCDAAKQPFSYDLSKNGSNEPCLAYKMSKLINGYCIGGDGEVGVYSYVGTNELLFRVEKYKQTLVFSKKFKKQLESKGWVSFKCNKNSNIPYYSLMNTYDYTAKTLIRQLEYNKFLT